MTALQLYKFIKEHNVEYYWYDNDVILFVDCCNIAEFNKLLPTGIYEDSGLKCAMKEGYFCFEMKHICEYCDIAEMTDIFEPNK